MDLFCKHGQNGLVCHTSGISCFSQGMSLCESVVHHNSYIYHRLFGTGCGCVTLGDFVDGAVCLWVVDLPKVVYFVRYIDLRREISGQFFDGLLVIFVITDVLKHVEDLVDLWTAIVQQKGSFQLAFLNTHSLSNRSSHFFNLGPAFPSR